MIYFEGHIALKRENKYKQVLLKKYLNFLEIVRGHCPAGLAALEGALAGDRNGNWGVVGVRLAGITSQLFLGLESTLGGTNFAAAKW